MFKVVKMLVVTGLVIFAIPIRVNAAIYFDYTFDANFGQVHRDAMMTADDFWSSALTEGLTIKVKVGWGDPAKMTSDTGAVAVAHTLAPLLHMDYTHMRDRMVSDESQEGMQNVDRNGLVRWLPHLDQFAGDRALFENRDPVIYATRANWRALGFTKNHYYPGTNNCDSYGNCWDLYENKTLIGDFDAYIRFNPDYFDGVEKSDRDFIGVAAHELGHALGFQSEADQTYRNVGLSTLDMFRFADYRINPGQIVDSIPTTLDEFRENQRNLSGTGLTTLLLADHDISAQEFTKFPIQKKTKVAQASHWADRNPPNEIGVMDPGQKEYFSYPSTPHITAADFYAMDLIGWDIDSTIYKVFVANQYGDPLDWFAFTPPPPPLGSTIEVADYSPTAGSVMGDLITKSGITPTLLKEELNAIDISQVEDCRFILDPACSFPPTFASQLQFAYEKNPSAMMDAFLSDLLANSDLLKEPSNIPWLTDAGGYATMSIMEFPPGTAPKPTTLAVTLAILSLGLAGIGYRRYRRKKTE